MTKLTAARLIVFVLAWVNTFLASHNIKPIPAIDETQVALWITFVISAYEWIKHCYNWIKTNWGKDKQPPEQVVAAEQTAVSVDATIPTQPTQPTAQAQTVESTTQPTDGK
jgi:SPP1 family holin